MTDLSGYMLGRAAERSHRNSLELTEQLVARFQGRAPVNLGALQQENAQLRDALARLRDHVNALNRHIDGQEDDYGRLRHWADAASIKLRAYEGQ